MNTSAATTSDLPLILLVDDMPDNLQLLAMILRKEYRIKTATRGDLALELAARLDTPDLILLDVMLPDMNGYQVLEKLRENPATREIPVIFITADTTEQGEVRGLEQGADDYLIKPVEAPILRARVKNLLLRSQAQEQLRLAAQVFDNTSEGIVIADAASRILDVNRAFCELTGYSREESIGKTTSLTRSGRHDDAFYQAMWRSLNETGRWEGEIWDRRKSGEVFPKWLCINAIPDLHGRVSRYVGIFSDITALKQAEATLHRMAFHDALTGLPNRIKFRDRLEQEIAHCRRKRTRAAVLFLDLDRFKQVNDTLGHQAGDDLLVEMAKRLQSELRETDVVARLGGDEFTIILNDIPHTQSVAHVADKLIERIGEPFILKGEKAFVGGSIGISLFPDDGEDYETLTRHADTAMYHAKESGRGQFRFFTEVMDQETRHRMALESDLRHALERGEFRLFFQPLVDARDGRLVGAEALLRWFHPERGVVSPLDFIPIAEETGLILAIGQWVLEESCRHLAKWRDMGFPRLRMAVNLSARQFRQGDLRQVIDAILARHAIAADDLELEITESTAMDKADTTVQLLACLRMGGVHFSIDDFGTGYSSLAYLKRFPVEKLKIDRSFVADVPGNADDTAIVAAIVQLAKSLGLRVVAEGVETREQLDHLRDLGCDFIQGYFFSRPLEAEKFVEYMQQNQKDFP